MSARKVHELKTWPEPFQALVDGRKHHEVRVDNRGFAVGDHLLLREWNPVDGAFTGRKEVRVVTYKSDGGHFGLPAMLCVLSVEPVS